MQLKNYQLVNIDKLIDRSKDLLSQNGNKKLVFKSPTGSGKTIMMAEFIKQLATDKTLPYELAFIWTAPRQLHNQSKIKLSTYFINNRALECSYFDDLNDRQIQNNEILFFNWESINKKDNIYIRENEKDNNLSKIIERTIDSGRSIILIIDESHHHATSQISKNLISDIEAKLVIEVSATPIVENPDEIVSVPIEDVKLEGMIKKSVALNPNSKNIFKGNKIESTLSKETEDIVLKYAIEKRKKLAELYKLNHINVNPLLLIQLPDKKTKLEEVIKHKVIELLKTKYKITTENRKLAIYLSENKENIENLVNNDNETEVLIFKQAIALGWDCPRAQILVLFRDWKSLNFSIQTIGRIMRMPNPEHGHYTNESLNKSYVYTNIGHIEIHEDIADNYLTINTSKRITKYKSIALPSIYRKRRRETTRLKPLFIEIFLEEANKYKLDKVVKLRNQKVELSIISNYNADNIDKLINANINGKLKLHTTNINELQKILDYFARDNISPLYPEPISIGRIKESIYTFFSKKFNIEYYKDISKVINITLSKSNKQHFSNVIEIAIGKYLKKIKTKESQFIKIDDWEIPEDINTSSSNKLIRVKKSVLKPFYYNDKWKTEREFIKYLEKSNKIIWWFKNGEQDSKYFAVPYKENNIDKLFYIDFIIYTKPNRIWLLDTKSGQTIDNAKAKSNGLQTYIRKQVKKGKKIKGGIVTNTKPNNFSGHWVYYEGRGIKLNSEDLSNWPLLDL